MLAIRRHLASAAGKAGSRRYASTGHDHHAAAPKAESLGTAFYITIAAVPASYLLYTASRPGADGKPTGLTTLINKYSDFKDSWTNRNSTHTSMIEQAAFDRNLFHSNRGSPHINLRFPEIFNTGSPYNVSAGQGARDMDAVVAHYEKLNAEAEEKKLKALAEKK